MKIFVHRVLAFACLLLPSPAVLAQQWGREGYGPHMGWGSGVFFGPLMTLVFIAVVVIVVMSLVRWLSGDKSKRPSATSQDAMDILKERFAKGEIDREEFEERRRVLTSDP
ncbi:SHOCT domain-containing protein [Aestuariirhabdus sp. LZHN29]|uniref:SHOCT domain-containing protein n=1 Tax=Aestuariirhabdus sp. LZHN29 TaxID=3417462 RepID=UPI003CEC4476